MIFSPRFFRTTTIVTLVSVALLPVACNPKQSQEQSDPAAPSEQAAQPRLNGLPPDQFLAEFGAMGYAIDAPWSDTGGDTWSARAHKQYENNQLLLVMGSSTQWRIDQIELNAVVVDGTLSERMREAFELGIRTAFAGMELRPLDKAIEAARSESPFEGEAGRFGVQITRADDPKGGYVLSLRMISR